MSDSGVMLDPLTEVLRVARVEAALFSRAEGRAPWGVHTHGARDGIFHVVLHGQGHARALQGARTLAARDFGEGDLLIFPHGHAHALSDARATPTRWIAELPSRPGDDGLPVVQLGGGAEELSILCGTLRFDAEAAGALLPYLPAMLHARGDSLGGWVDATVRQLAHEAQRGGPGSGLVVARLAEILFVQAVRAWVAAPEQGASGWVRALGDPSLARALSLLHGAPEQPWSMERLARRAGMSRTGLYDRFTATVGEAPAAYLARWRMTLARRALRDPRASIPEVAARVGYGSEAAFNRAFKRVVGAPPGEWRRREQGEAAAR